MRQRTAYEFDNRDSAQMYEYIEARIEALKHSKRTSRISLRRFREQAPGVSG
jgi:hypothetical protein